MLEGHGYQAHFVAGDDPLPMHQAFAATLDTCYQKIRALQHEARAGGATDRTRWPAIILRTPKGWTGRHELDGRPMEGTFRAHQVPLDAVRGKPEQFALLG